MDSEFQEILALHYKTADNNQRVYEIVLVYVYSTQLGNGWGEKQKSLLAMSLNLNC